MLAAGEFGMIGNVGRAGEIGVVAGDQHLVLGQNQVRLDAVGAFLQRQLVACDGVLGPLA